MTTFGDRVYELGGALVGQMLIPPGGTWYYVDGANGLDSNPGTSPGQALKTVSAAYAKCVTGKNDVVAVVQSTSGILEAAAITWSKNLTHLVGLAAPVHCAQRARIVCNADDLSPFLTISGYGCIFSNVYIWQGRDDAHSLINVSVSGDRNYFYNVHFAGGGHATQAVDGGASLQLNGCEECLFERCTIGVDTAVCSTGYACLSVAATGGAARNKFEDCTFRLFTTGGTTPQGAMFVELLGNAGMDRDLHFRRCTFMNMGVTPLTSAFVLAAGFDLNNKRVLLESCASIGVTDWDSGGKDVLYLNNGAITGGGNAGQFIVANAT